MKFNKQLYTFSSIPDNYYGVVDHITNCLNDIPIFYAHSPGCPTCASLIATGLGIERTKCSELEKISNKINGYFISINHSIESIESLLRLLESGLYIIADMLCYPTDGNEKFFWNTSNNYTENLATQAGIMNDSDFMYTTLKGILNLKVNPESRTK